MRSIFSFVLIFTILVPYAEAGKKVDQYQVPSVKDSFCGPVINYQYCKCAFHNELCKSIGMSSSGAHGYVTEAFREWNAERIERMAIQCKVDEGYWNVGDWSCTTCTDGDFLEGSKCVEPGKTDAERKECQEALQDFKKNWEKYSDFGNRFDEGVSWEVQQFNQLMIDIGDLSALAQDIQGELVINAEVRSEIIAYKAALVSNLRNNITKAIFRLAWVTYNTVNAAKGSEGTVKKLLDPKSQVQVMGATMKLLQAHIPKDAKEFQIDTASTSGKVASMAWNATLEAIESVGDRSAIVQQGMKDMKSFVGPGPDMTPEEVEILRTQHLSNKAVDEAIAQNQAETAELRKTLLQTKKLIVQKYNEAQEWKLKEYQRVKYNLEDQCKEK